MNFIGRTKRATDDYNYFDKNQDNKQFIYQIEKENKEIKKEAKEKAKELKKKEKSLKNKGIEKLGDKSTKTSIPNVVLTHVLKLKTAEDYGVKYRNSQSAKKKKQTPKKGGATPRLNQSGTSLYPESAMETPRIETNSSGGLSREEDMSKTNQTPLPQRTPITPKTPKKKKSGKINSGIDNSGVMAVSKYKQEHEDDKDVLEIFDKKVRESQVNFNPKSPSK